MTLYLRTLGPLMLHEEGPDGPPVLQGSKPLGLLTYLALTPGHTAGRPYLATLFWPGRDRSRALGSLRQAIYYIGKKVDEPLLDADAESVTLVTEHLRVDVWDFKRHLDAGRREEAIDLWNGDFLQGLRGPEGPEMTHWVQAQAERIRVGLRSALEKRVDEAISDDRPDLALVYAGKLTTLEPRDEAATRALIRAHLAAGSRVGAVNTYQRYRADLVDHGLASTDEDLDALTDDLRKVLMERYPEGAPLDIPATAPGAPPVEPLSPEEEAEARERARRRKEKASGKSRVPSWITFGPPLRGRWMFPSDWRPFLWVFIGIVVGAALGTCLGLGTTPLAGESPSVAPPPSWAEAAPPSHGIRAEAASVIQGAPPR